MRDEKAVTSVEIANDICVIRRRGRINVTIAKVLGTECDIAGRVNTLWLDRIVHRSDESVFADEVTTWSLSGAITTILTRKLPLPNQPNDYS